MGFSGLAAWDEDLKVLLQDAPVAGARLLQRLLRPVNLALVVVVIDVELPGRGGVLFGWMTLETSSLLLVLTICFWFLLGPQMVLTGLGNLLVGFYLVPKWFLLVLVSLDAVITRVVNPRYIRQSNPHVAVQTRF